MDAVTRIISLLHQTPRDGWESVLCRELGGQTVYIRASTGLHKVRLLQQIGLPARTSHWKVYGR
jgi:hypothetical protein